MTRQNAAGGLTAVSTLWNVNENAVEIDRNDSYYIGFTILSVPITIANSRVACEMDKLFIGIYEGESWTGGTLLDLFNKNRVTGAQPVFSVERNINPINNLNNVVPISAVVIRSQDADFGVIEGQNVQNQWVFKPNTQYIMRFFNDTNNNNREIDYSIVFDELFYAKED